MNSFQLKLLIFGAVIGFLSTVYSKLMFTIYCMQWYEHWDHFIKICTNQKSHHERSLARNLLFNLIRCLAGEAFGEFIVGAQLQQEVLIERVILIVVMVVAVHFFLPKSRIEKHCHAWSYIFTMFGCSYGILWLNDLTQAEIWSQGDLSKFLLYALFNGFTYMICDFIEDLICRDLGVVGGIWHNWGYYWPPVSIVFIGYFMQYFYRSHDFF